MACHLEELVTERLQLLQPRRLSTKRQAAVLMAIVNRSAEPSFLLTRRSRNVATHKGQISFPGGIREAADRDLVATALRETEEEIGVASSQVCVLGEFHDYLSITDFSVRPVLGAIAPEARFEIHPGEVEYLLEIPWSFFRTTGPAVRQRLHNGVLHDVYFYDFQGEIVWGLTARMVKDFIDFLDS